MYTSSQELNKFCYKILSCNNSSWSQPYSWTQKKKHFPRVFHRVVKDTNTLQLLLAYYIFGFSCLTRASKTARRQMIWTRDFRSFLLIVPSLCTQTWLGECFYMIRLLRTLETLANGKRALNELRIKKIWDASVWRNLAFDLAVENGPKTSQACLTLTLHPVIAQSQLSKVLYGEVPPGGSNPYPFIYHPEKVPLSFTFYWLIALLSHT